MMMMMMIYTVGYYSHTHCWRITDYTNTYHSRKLQKDLEVHAYCCQRHWLQCHLSKTWAIERHGPRSITLSCHRHGLHRCLSQTRDTQVLVTDTSDTGACHRHGLHRCLSQKWTINRACRIHGLYKRLSQTWVIQVLVTDMLYTRACHRHELHSCWS